MQSDGELIGRIKAGEAAAIETLIRRHRPRVAAQARGMLGDADEAETAAQEVCLRVLRSIDRFQGEAKFTTWLYRITENVCLTMLAKERNERAKIEAFGLLQDAEAPRDGGLDAEDGFEALLSGLGQDEKQLLVLRFVHEREIKDIAVVFDTGLSAAKMRLYRTLAKLRERVSR